MGAALVACWIAAEALPLSAVAERVGVSREVIADLEAGKIEPWADLIEHIAGVLGRRLRDFAEE